MTDSLHVGKDLVYKCLNEMLRADTTCFNILILKVSSPNTILCLHNITDVKIEEPYNWYRAALRNLIHVTSCALTNTLY